MGSHDVIIPASRSGKPRWITYLAAVGALALLLAACGGEGGGGSGTPTPTTPTSPTTPGGEPTTPGEEPTSFTTFEHELTYEALVAAAANEPPVHFCQAMDIVLEWEPIVDHFVAEFPDVPRPEASECNGTESRERVLAEWQAGLQDVDVASMATDFVERIMDNDLGAVVDWSVFDGTPLEVDPKYVGPENRMLGVAGGNGFIVYNSELISFEDAPKSIEECADPKYRGQIAVDIRPTRIVDFLPHWGPDGMREWAEGILANEPLWVRGGGPMVIALQSGERAFGCPVHMHALFRGVRAVDDDDHVLQYIFVSGDHSPYIMPTFSPNPKSPNGVMLFGAWMASPQGHAAYSAICPCYDDPWQPGTWKYDEHQRFGTQPVTTNEDTWEVMGMASEAFEILQGVWGNPTADRS